MFTCRHYANTTNRNLKSATASSPSPFTIGMYYASSVYSSNAIGQIFRDPHLWEQSPALLTRLQARDDSVRIKMDHHLMECLEAASPIPAATSAGTSRSSTGSPPPLELAPHAGLSTDRQLRVDGGIGFESADMEGAELDSEDMEALWMMLRARGGENIKLEASGPKGGESAEFEVANSREGSTYEELVLEIDPVDHIQSEHGLPPKPFSASLNKTAPWERIRARDPNAKDGDISYLLADEDANMKMSSFDPHMARYIMYSEACFSRDMLSLELRKETDSPALVIFPALIEKTLHYQQRLLQRLQDDISDAQRASIADTLALGEHTLQENMAEMEAAQQRAAAIRARCAQADRDLAEYARAHGLTPMTFLPPDPDAAAGFPPPKDSLRDFVLFDTPADPKVLVVGPNGSWYGARYDALAAPSGSGTSRAARKKRAKRSPTPAPVEKPDGPPDLEPADGTGSAGLSPMKRKFSDADIPASAVDSSSPKKSKGEGSTVEQPGSLDKGKGKEVYLN
ncbi:hypothetical protein HWV62_16720 [Athelia sp. TMB]|nr:hypothetical protein HWV62_16720 [Athelia sp. TMB]